MLTAKISTTFLSGTVMVNPSARAAFLSTFLNRNGLTLCRIDGLKVVNCESTLILLLWRYYGYDGNYCDQPRI
jgi:hypothetical protein